jgi:hypothetical protein
MKETVKSVQFGSNLEEEKMGIQVGGFFGLVILIADIWAIVKTFESPGSTGTKVLWIVLILLLPVLGLIIWLIAGPRVRKH